MSTPFEARLTQLFGDSGYTAELKPPARASILASEPQHQANIDEFSKISPIIVAYDERIAELEGQNRLLQNTINSIRGQLGEVSKENENLLGQLRDNALELLRRGKEDSETQLLRGKREDDEWAELNQRLELTQRENDLLLQQNRLLFQEKKELLESQLDYEDKLQQATASAQPIPQMMPQYAQTVPQYIPVMPAPQPQYTPFVQSAPAQMQQPLMHQQYVLPQQQLPQQQQQQQPAAQQQSFIQATSSEREVLSESIQVLEQQLYESQQRELQIQQRVKETVEVAEDARLARDQSLVREQQASREVDRLSQKVSRLTSEMNGVIEAERQSLTRQWEGRVKSLQEELRVVEMDRAELRAEVDRSLREQRTLETELRGICARAPGDSTRSTAALEDALSKLARAERERDDARHECDGATSSYTRQRVAWDQQRVQYVEEIDSLTKRLAITEGELNACKEHRARLTIQVEQLAQREREATIGREVLERQHHHEVSKLTTTLSARVRDLETQLLDSHEAHHRGTSELQVLLETQHAAADKWRDESRKATLRVEHVVKALKEELQRQTARSEELSRRIARLQAEKAELLASRSGLERSVDDCRQMAQDAQQRFDEATVTISRLIARETELTAQLSDLQTGLDRAQMERDRFLRESTRRQHAGM